MPRPPVGCGPRPSSGPRWARPACAAWPGWALASLGSWAFMIALSVYAYGGAGPGGRPGRRGADDPRGLAAPFTGLLGDRFSRRDVLVVLSAGRAVVPGPRRGGRRRLRPAGPRPRPRGRVHRAADRSPARPQRAGAAAGLLAPRSSPRRPRSPTRWRTPRSSPARCSAASSSPPRASPPASRPPPWPSPWPRCVLATIRRDAVPAHRETPTGASVAREALAGFPEVWAEPASGSWSARSAVTTLIEGAVDVLVVVSALQLLDMGTDGVGWLNAAWGVGGVPAAACPVLLGRGRLSSGLAAGSCWPGAPLAIAALPRVPVAVAVLVVLGVGYTLIETAGHSLVQRLASDHLLARAFGVVETSYHVATGVGSILASGVIALLGVRGAPGRGAAARSSCSPPCAGRLWPASRAGRSCPSASSACCAASRSARRCPSPPSRSWPATSSPVAMRAGEADHPRGRARRPLLRHRRGAHAGVGARSGAAGAGARGASSGRSPCCGSARARPP